MAMGNTSFLCFLASVLELSLNLAKISPTSSNACNLRFLALSCRPASSMLCPNFSRNRTLDAWYTWIGTGSAATYQQRNVWSVSEPGLMQESKLWKCVECNRLVWLFVCLFLEFRGKCSGRTNVYNESRAEGPGGHHQLSSAFVFPCSAPNHSWAIFSPRRILDPSFGCNTVNVEKLCSAG